MSFSTSDVAIIKGMLKRGDRQSDIAAYFGVNGGRIAEINTGERHHDVTAAPLDDSLPPPGPYVIGLPMAEARAMAAALVDLANRLIAAVERAGGK
jgi:hypothetical protein